MFEVLRLKHALAATVLFVVPALAVTSAQSEPLYAANESVTVEALGDGPEIDGPELEGPEIEEIGNGAPTPLNYEEPGIPVSSETPAALEDPFAGHQSVEGSVEAAPVTEAEAPASIAAELEGQRDALPVSADPLMEAAAEDGEATLSEDLTGERAGDGAEQQNIEVAAVTPDEKTDIYDRWSKNKFQGRSRVKQHPLASHYPDDFVVVCEAGCSNEAEQIVYQERKSARGPVNSRSLKRGAVAGTGAIDCVGGCYGHRSSYAMARRGHEAGMAAAAEETNGDHSWMSTGNQESDESKKKNGRWYQRIN